MSMNRREFVKAGAGAFAIASAGRLFGEEAPARRVRLAIVGCRPDARAGDLMNAVFKLKGEGVDLATVCDVDSRGMEAAAALVERKTGRRPKTEGDIRRVLADRDIDGVILATPDHWHAPGAIMALRAGKHVYVEKPCAFCPREGEVLLETWKKSGKVLQVGTQRRSAPIMREVLDEIRTRGVIGTPRWGKCWYTSDRSGIGHGKVVPVPDWLNWDLWQGPAPRTAFRDNIVHYRWHWHHRWGTGECGNNMVHFADLARAALGVTYPERTVAGGGRIWIREDDEWVWPDTTNCTFEFPGQRIITWEGLSCVRAKPFLDIPTGALIYGEKGSVLLKPNNTATLFDKKGALVKDWTGVTRVADVTDTNNRRSGGAGDSTAAHLLDFVRCIRANTPEAAAANPTEGVPSTQLALLANIAQRTGETIRTDAATGALTGLVGRNLWAREYEKGWEI